MRLRAALLLIIALGATNAMTGKRTVERKHSLGNGFQIITVAIDLSDCKDCFEGIAYYKELWYRNRTLSSTVGEYSLSPAKRFAIFEDTGKLMLFDANSAALTDVTDGSFEVPSEFHWRESARSVAVKYYGNHAESTIKLPD